MKDIIKAWKRLNNIDKTLVLITCIIMILLVGNFIISVRHISQFNSIRNSGNDRWVQVEERIINYERRINQLENMIENLK